MESSGEEHGVRPANEGAGEHNVFCRMERRKLPRKSIVDRYASAQAGCCYEVHTWTAMAAASRI